MSEIDKILKDLESLSGDYNTNCIRIFERLANRGIYRKIDEQTLLLNSRFGEYDLFMISDHIKDLGEFMCKYKIITLKETNFLSDISEIITETAILIHDKIDEIDPNYDQLLTKRNSKSNLLTLTKRINKNLQKFGKKETVIRKIYFSFEQVNKSLAKVKEDLDNLSQQKQTDEINFKKASISWIENAKKDLNFTQNFIEDLETIIFFLIFYFENQESILYPLSHHLNETSRMLEKYLKYHVAFRITYGSNYLNQIKSIVNQITKLFEDDLAEIRSHTFVLNELRRRYLDLVFLEEIESFNSRLIKQDDKTQPKLMLDVQQEINVIFNIVIEEFKN